MDAINNKVDNGGTNAQGIYEAGESNQVTSEILKVITAAGQTPSASVVDQLMAGLDKFVTGFGFWCTDTGSGGSYAIANQNSSFTRISGLYDGLTLKFRPSTNNTNTSATPALTYRGTSYNLIGEEVALVAGDISDDRDCEIRYNGSTFVVLQRSIGRQVANIYPPGYIDGLTITWSSSSTIIIQIGSAFTHSTPAGTKVNADLSSTRTKNITNTWVAGTGGGRPSSVSVAADTWYRVFIIAGSSGVDAGFDTSATAAALLTAAGSGYVNYRQIGWIKTDSSSDVIKFFNYQEDPNYFFYADNNDEDYSSSIVNNTATTVVSKRCPPNGYAYIYASIIYNSSNNNRHINLLVQSYGSNSSAVTASNKIASGRSSSGDIQDTGYAKIKLNASGQYTARIDNNGGDTTPIVLSTHAYSFHR